ncbi:HAD family hydrolase [Chloroflexota bacterium]
MIISKTWALGMVKAVFFDWFQTLAHFEPPRHQLYSRVFQEFGIELSPQKVMRSILVADQYFFKENIKSPVAERSSKEQTEVYLHYPKIILTEAGVKAPRELLLKILKMVMRQYKGITFALFDDVLSTLKALKQRNFILGLLTNIAKEMTSFCHELGVEAYLDFVVTSKEVGVDKPEPPIFLAALDKAGVKASEAVHVGDQYKLDVVGARAVGINPILIDRYDMSPEVNDCPRIHNLTELAQYL